MQFPRHEDSRSHIGSRLRPIEREIYISSDLSGGGAISKRTGDGALHTWRAGGVLDMCRPVSASFGLKPPATAGFAARDGDAVPLYLVVSHASRVVTRERARLFGEFSRLGSNGEAVPGSLSFFLWSDGIPCPGGYCLRVRQLAVLT